MGGFFIPYRRRGKTVLCGPVGCGTVNRPPTPQFNVPAATKPPVAGQAHNPVYRPPNWLGAGGHQSYNPLVVDPNVPAVANPSINLIPGSHFLPGVSADDPAGGQDIPWGLVYGIGLPTLALCYVAGQYAYRLATRPNQPVVATPAGPVLANHPGGSPV